MKKSIFKKSIIILNQRLKMKKILLLLLLPIQFMAQNPSLQSFKSYPFPTELCSAAKGAKIAWALDEQGKRNVYVAEGPDYKPQKLTQFNTDDGQEISSLSISDDGEWVVFVRGGDHGGNWETGLPVNSTFDPKPFNVKIASVPFKGGDVKYISEGEEPTISPNGKTVAFIKGGQVWTAPIDSANVAKNLFITRGTVGSLAWNTEGSALLFVSNRVDHSIIGIYSNATTPIQWVAPSFTFDESPHWSLDNKKIVFTEITQIITPPSTNIDTTPWFSERAVKTEAVLDENFILFKVILIFKIGEC